MFLRNNSEIEAGRLVPNLLLFFKKALYEVKASGLSSVLIYIDSPQLGLQQKQAIRLKTVDPEIR